MPSRTPRFNFAPPRPKAMIQVKSTYDHNWRRLRQRVLAAEPLCRHCQAQGLVTPAVQVDHITPKTLGGPDAFDNCQPLCLECHQAKTRRDIQRITRGF